MMIALIPITVLSPLLSPACSAYMGQLILMVSWLILTFDISGRWRHHSKRSQLCQMIQTFIVVMNIHW